MAPVSYTHLDVYKRQHYWRWLIWGRKVKIMKLEFLNHKIPPPVILLISGIAIWLFKNIAPLPIPYSIRAILGTLFIIFGFGLDLVGLLEFRKFQTTMNPLKPENASKIVQTGIYSKTRNPMYLGMVFVLIGWSIISLSLIHI